MMMAAMPMAVPSSCRSQRARGESRHACRPESEFRRRRCNVRSVENTAVAQTSTAGDDRVELGKSGVVVPAIGIGAWSWGDRSGYWGWSKEQEAQNKAALRRAVDLGIDFIDTAEVYGFGLSEELCGRFIDELEIRPAIATKFAPLPWRLTREAVPQALRQSLDRLQMGRLRNGLYMLHWPGFFLNAFSNDEYIAGLMQCKTDGLCDAVGVSNFNADRIRRAVRTLGDAGIPLASNQVQVSSWLERVRELCLASAVE